MKLALDDQSKRLANAHKINFTLSLAIAMIIAASLITVFFVIAQLVHL
jgi:hypothetical protein